jgi:hypothetical protein
MFYLNKSSDDDFIRADLNGMGYSHRSYKKNSKLKIY